MHKRHEVTYSTAQPRQEVCRDSRPTHTELLMKQRNISSDMQKIVITPTFALEEYINLLETVIQTSYPLHLCELPELCHSFHPAKV